MAKNVILTFYMTLTFTFDLGGQKFICLSISYNMRQVGSLHDKWNQSYGQQGKKQKNCFHSCDLDLDPMTLIYKLDLGSQGQTYQEIKLPELPNIVVVEVCTPRVHVL